MPKPLTLMMAAVVGAALAVLALGAVTQQLVVSSGTAASQADDNADPEFYGAR
ncbi:hypothetical protein ACIBTV_00045 [Micromonospora sp. NPDC049366]|uniref:Uncharacterized protein n=1 Tax=Micromonospora krabiensis TaxID=307121 RepID=A0A1C3N909_9ACTN|nr:hypothetical protein [Micromonospora krabiensis]SBV29075.1 hypothetical protein GA0070620_4640 [Micromonospora krabiensis]